MNAIRHSVVGAVLLVLLVSAWAHDPEPVQRLRSEPAGQVKTPIAGANWNGAVFNGPNTVAEGGAQFDGTAASGSCDSGFLSGLVEEQALALYPQQPPTPRHAHTSFVSADIESSLEIGAKTTYAARGEFKGEIKVRIWRTDECPEGEAHRNKDTGEILLFESIIKGQLNWYLTGAPRVDPLPLVATKQVYDKKRVTAEETAVQEIKPNPGKIESPGKVEEEGSDVHIKFKIKDAIQHTCSFTDKARLMVTTSAHISWTMSDPQFTGTAWNFEIKVTPEKKNGKFLQSWR